MDTVAARQLSAAPAVSDAGRVYRQRFGHHGEAYILSLIPDLNALADEGCYFTANNGQTGIATAATPTAFSATNPFLLIFNNDATGGKRIYLDSVTLTATAAGTAGASVQCAVTIDSTNRYTSGGSALTPVNVNMDDATATIAVVHAGNITAAAASGSVRTVAGQRYLKGAIPVAGDEYSLKFGSATTEANITISTIMKTGIKLPPVIIGPQQSALVHLWLPSQSAASSYAPELSWWER